MQSSCLIVTKEFEFFRKHWICVSQVSHSEAAAADINVEEGRVQYVKKKLKMEF